MCWLGQQRQRCELNLNMKRAQVNARASSRSCRCRDASAGARNASSRCRRLAGSERTSRVDARSWATFAARSKPEVGSPPLNASHPYARGRCATHTRVRTLVFVHATPAQLIDFARPTRRRAVFVCCAHTHTWARFCTPIEFPVATPPSAEIGFVRAANALRELA